MPSAPTANITRARRVPAVAPVLAAWVVCCALMMVGSTPAQGQEIPASTEPRLRLALAPQARAFALEHDLSAEQAAELHQSLARGAWRYFAPGDEFALIAPDHLTEAITSEALYEGTLALARQWHEMGEESFKRLEPADAIKHLERALQNYRAIHHDVIQPEEVAQTLRFLALSYLEDGTNVVRPLELMQEMILLDPQRRILPGYYPDFIVQYYQSARNTLWRELEQRGPSLEQARREAGIVGADLLLYTFAFPALPASAQGGAPVDAPAAGITVVAYLYDAREDAFLPPESISLRSLQPELLQSAANRLASRLAACVLEPLQVAEPAPADLVASRGQGRLSLELGLAYASFLKVDAPLQTPFGNVGMGLGADYALTREFGLVAGLQILNSMRDYDGLLREDFTTFRAWAGGRLAWEIGPLELGIAASFELANLSPMRVFTDKSCIPAPDLLCPGDLGTRTFENKGASVGARLNPRISWRLNSSLWLTLNSSLSYYIGSPDERPINLPVSTDLGIRYRF
ncbi:hypothetical protein DL240_14225 [Lujinxingia litoralis]|uniref:Uncharacterized protein n=1 Tax=Lujinxingia litoralis TaxID=2211119 RepID=A0A328C774_9DELT|nr:hypothetical protein [Lujinxingia litoralis]RAL21277.1 hypothetical protein DL240_14225 [Lujinxingia litoralis]